MRRMGADKGSGGLWNNSAGDAGKDPAGSGRQSDRRVEHIPDHPGRRTHHDLFERQARRGSCDPGKLLEPHHCRFRPTAPFSFRPTTTRSTGGTSQSAKFPADEANQILAKHGAEGFQLDLQRPGPDGLGRARSKTTK